MVDYTSWIGTGDGELCQNLAEAGTALAAELSEYDGSFTLKQTDLFFTPASEWGGIVYGTLHAIPANKAAQYDLLTGIYNKATINAYLFWSILS